MRVLVEMIDARGVERGRAPLDAMNGIAAPKQIVREICTILSGYTGD
jgi:hypothetical protein